MLSNILIKVNNLPVNFRDYKYLTIRMCDGAWWYYGGWRDDFEGALTQAVEIRGQVVGSDMVQEA